MRYFLIALVAIAHINCSAPQAGDSEEQASTTYCNSAQVAAMEYHPTSVKPLALTSHPKVKLDLTVTNLKQPQGPSQLLLDFKSGLFSDPRQIVVPAATKLVAVVDHNCTHNKGYSVHSRSGRFFSEKAMSEQAENFQNNRFAKKTHSHSVAFNQDLSIEQIQELADEDECLTMVSSNVEFYTFATVPVENSGSYYAQQTHLNFIKFNTAYDQFYVTAGGITQGVTIAIIDSGVDIGHSEFSGITWVNPNGEVGGNNIDEDGNGYKDDVNGFNFASNIPSPHPQVWPGDDQGSEGHGTHVAGLAAARTNNAAASTVGVMGHSVVRVMGLNVFGAFPSADTATIDEAIRYAYENGADVINLSLGGFGKVASTGTALQEAIDNGVVVIAAAGNSNRLLDSSTFMTPASYGSEKSGMIAVGSVDVINGNRSSFSNCGNQVIELAAPGAHTSASDTGGLVSTLPGNQYGKSMGTSMSSPIVAGAAALVIGMRRTKGTLPATPALIAPLVESDLVNHSMTNSTLTPYFKNGKVLDLKALADFLAP
jgi:subtilisin family serine protease